MSRELDDRIRDTIRALGGEATRLNIVRALRGETPMPTVAFRLTELVAAGEVREAVSGTRFTPVHVLPEAPPGSIAVARETLEDAEAAMNARHAAEKREMQARWERLRAQCPHEGKRWVPGHGADGYYVCETCGAWGRDL